jgi:hypothetical protein
MGASIPAHLIHLDIITLILGEECELSNPLFIQLSIVFLFLGSKWAVQNSEQCNIKDVLSLRITGCKKYEHENEISLEFPKLSRDIILNRTWNWEKELIFFKDILGSSAEGPNLIYTEHVSNYSDFYSVLVNELQNKIPCRIAEGRSSRNGIFLSLRLILY